MTRGDPPEEGAHNKLRRLSGDIREKGKGGSGARWGEAGGRERICNGRRRRGMAGSKSRDTRRKRITIGL